MESSNKGIGVKEVRWFREGEWTTVADQLAVEEPLNIRIGSRSLVITMRTPGQDPELALGFLFTEGIITGPEQVVSVEIGRDDEEDLRNTVTVKLHSEVQIDWAGLQRHNYVSSSCGVCGKTSLEQVGAVLPFGELPERWSVAPKLITGLPDKLRTAQVLFAKTGGIHAAGLFTLSGELLHFTEDVGRHNALDKLLGYCLREGQLPLRRRILVLSGRASFELIQKAGMAGISLVVAVGAPSSLAVELAQELGMTLCGFVRGGGGNVYAGERIE